MGNKINPYQTVGKMARREGVDFILDPMLAPINPDLNEHVDGITSALSKKKITTP